MITGTSTLSMNCTKKTSTNLSMSANCRTSTVFCTVKPQAPVVVQQRVSSTCPRAGPRKKRMFSSMVCGTMCPRIARSVHCLDHSLTCTITGKSTTLSRTAHNCAIWTITKTAQQRAVNNFVHERHEEIPGNSSKKRPWTDAEPRSNFKIGACIHVEIPGNPSKNVRGLTRTPDLPTRAGHQPCPRTGRTKNNERCNCRTTTVFSTVSPSTRPPPQPPRPHLCLHRPARTSAPTPTRSSRPKPHACCHVRPPRPAPWPHGIARTMGRDNVGELGDTATVV